MIIKTIKEVLYYCKQLIAISIFNIVHNTTIYSARASLKAEYGIRVNIGKNTTVAANVKIGNDSYVNENSWVENCEIGRWCSISDHVLICPAEHNISRILSSPVLGNKTTSKVIIGDDVLISHGVTILEGVTIGNGAVVAAGAVVTKNIPPMSIWGRLSENC
jgi:acetyltransferase-like isoleucine patch superfamily enzyme